MFHDAIFLLVLLLITKLTHCIANKYNRCYKVCKKETTVMFHCGLFITYVDFLQVYNREICLITSDTPDSFL